MAQLTLYYFNSCPFCRLVREYLARNNISVPMKNIQEDPAAREELTRIGGKSQVPCLIIDGKALYESLDIIEWFKKNWKK